jgi:hypothetical protein
MFPSALLLSQWTDFKIEMSNFNEALISPIGWVSLDNLF